MRSDEGTTEGGPQSNPLTVYRVHVPRTILEKTPSVSLLIKDICGIAGGMTILEYTVLGWWLDADGCTARDENMVWEVALEHHHLIYDVAQAIKEHTGEHAIYIKKMGPAYIL